MRAHMTVLWHAAYECHLLFFFNATATTEIYTLSLHDALPISEICDPTLRTHYESFQINFFVGFGIDKFLRSEEHTSELQSRGHLVCRLRLEKNNWTPLSSAH